MREMHFTKEWDPFLFFIHVLPDMTGINGSPNPCSDILSKFFSGVMYSIPTNPPHSLQEALEDIFTQKNLIRNNAFNDIAYLTRHSLFAREQILSHLKPDNSLHALVLQYLKESCDEDIKDIKNDEDFITAWNMLLRKISQKERNIANEFHLIANFEFNDVWLDSTLRKYMTLQEHFISKLDQDRFERLRQILNRALELCQAREFQLLESFSKDIEMLCQEMLDDIRKYPTRFSVEHMYRVVDIIKQKSKEKLAHIYAISDPKIEVTLLRDSYPSKRTIDIQISIKNDQFCSPAESVEILVQEDKAFFAIKHERTSLGSALHGDESKTILLPIETTQKAVYAKAFSLSLKVEYRTRKGERKTTSFENFSIRLYGEDEFELIDNPYTLAESGPVIDQGMFYGRNELIARISKSICENRQQSKSFVIFGQKRAGKSSILYHLKEKLMKESDLLILSLSLGSVIVEDVPFFRHLLWQILSHLKRVIEEEVKHKKRVALKLPFLRDKDFFDHPSPLSHFTDVFHLFVQFTKEKVSWRNVRIVLMIDEFQYIYDQIVQEKLSHDFMKNWKALLEENIFSTVLVGQDVMTKFKQQFPNEFGTTQDERVRYLEREYAIKLIDEPIRIGGKNGESRYRGKAMERILYLTAGSPFYIQMICNRLVEYMNREGAKFVTEADIDKVKSEMLEGANSLEINKFENLTSSGDTSPKAIGQEDALKVMRAIALNSKTFPCSRNSIVCETYKPIDAILDDLVKREVINREQGNSYTLRVGLFKEWLIAHP